MFIVHHEHEDYLECMISKSKSIILKYVLGVISELYERWDLKMTKSAWTFSDLLDGKVQEQDDIIYLCKTYQSQESDGNKITSLISAINGVFVALIIVLR